MAPVQLQVHGTCVLCFVPEFFCGESFGVADLMLFRNTPREVVLMLCARSHRRLHRVPGRIVPTLYAPRPEFGARGAGPGGLLFQSSLLANFKVP